MIKLKNYNGAVCEFGEVVHARDARPTTLTNKAEIRGVEGLWLGKVEECDEHIIAPLDGSPAVKVRSVRRSPNETRWNAKAIQECKCYPWAASGERMLATGIQTRRRYIPRGLVREHGASENCAAGET